MKYRRMQKAANGTTAVAAPIVAQSAKPAVVKTKKDFVLNFTPKKTEVFQDHVRLYF